MLTSDTDSAAEDTRASNRFGGGAEAFFVPSPFRFAYFGIFVVSI